MVRDGCSERRDVTRTTSHAHVTRTTSPAHVTARPCKISSASLRSHSSRSLPGRGISVGEFWSPGGGEVLPEVVAAVRQAKSFTVNIGHGDRIEALTIGPLAMYQPQVGDDRDALVAAVAAADALATAVPSVS